MGNALLYLSGGLMSTFYDTAAPKKAANLSVNSSLLEQARARDINLSATLEAALAEKIKRAKEAEWIEQNREAIERLNAFVEKHGLFNDEHRLF